MHRFPKFALAVSLAAASFMASALDVPFREEDWIQLAYRGIPANQVTLYGESLRIDVDNSSSPLIHPLNPPLRANRLRIKARIAGEITLPDNVKQGSRKADDFRLRVGVVYSGDQTLGTMQRLVAPRWIKTLFDLAPEKQGISRVEFYTTYTDPSLAGKELLHFATDLWRQHFVLEVQPDGTVDQIVSVPVDEDVVAFWVSSDGDETGSQFSVLIEQLTLESEQ